MIERKSSDFYTQALRELRLEESELEQKLRRIKNSPIPKKQAERVAYLNESIDLREKLEDIRAKKLLYLCELEKLEEDVEDFKSAEYCECIGYCYRKSIYVSGEGEILYLEADESGADKIGDPAFEPTALIPLDTLPEAEKAMILNYLDEAEETPLWFKHRND